MTHPIDGGYVRPLDADPAPSDLGRELHANGVHTYCPAECLDLWDENGDDRMTPEEEQLADAEQAINDYKAGVLAVIDPDLMSEAEYREVQARYRSLVRERDNLRDRLAEANR